MASLWNHCGMVHVREAAQSDESAVLAVWSSCGLIRPNSDPKEDFRLALQSPASTILALELEDLVIGAAVVGFDGHRAWFYYLGVNPEFQSAGNGRALVAAIEEWAIKQGAPKAMLMVRNTNVKVIGFYERLGYTVQETTVLGKPL